MQNARIRAQVCIAITRCGHQTCIFLGQHIDGLSTGADAAQSRQRDAAACCVDMRGICVVVGDGSPGVDHDSACCIQATQSHILGAHIDVARNCLEKAAAFHGDVTCAIGLCSQSPNGGHAAACPQRASG